MKVVNAQTEEHADEMEKLAYLLELDEVHYKTSEKGETYILVKKGIAISFNALVSSYIDLKATLAVNLEDL